MARSISEIRTLVDTGQVRSLSDSDLLLLHEVHEDLEDCTPPAEWVREELVRRGVIAEVAE